MAGEDTRDPAMHTEDSSLFTESFNRLSVNDHLDDGGDRTGPEGEPVPRTEEEYAQSQLTLRAIVSSKEAGVIIGKAGKNVADLRDETGVKAGVSKVVQGVPDRVLTVTGALDGISRAYAIVAKGLLEGAPMVGMGGILSNNGTHRKCFGCSVLRLFNASYPCFSDVYADALHELNFSRGWYGSIG
jgi:heterogeneous nuclear rnp K-like protein 2